MARFLKHYFTMALVLLAVTSGARAGEVYARIPAGTQLQVRMIERLSSETANVGDRFHGTLAAPVVVNGRTLFVKGADVTGEVVNVERSGRLSNPGELYLNLRTVRSRGRTYAVATEPFVIKGQSHAKSNVTKIGGGTAAGAIIGALAGGGKGAAIGAGVGAAAGTGAAAATGKRPAEVQSEAILIWVAGDPSAGTTAQAQPDQQPAPDRYAEQDERVSGEYRHARSDDRDEDEQGPAEFSPRERRVISECFRDDRSGLPPGLAKRDRLPPGLERQLQRNGTLPPGLQKRVRPLPEVCAERLPRLPRAWSRVVLSGRIILLDPRQRVVDIFWLERD
jgi:outer membrane lipoprotein SlyB